MDEVVARIRKETVDAELKVNAHISSEDEIEMLEEKKAELQQMRNLLNYYTASYSCGMSGATHEQTASGQGTQFMHNNQAGIGKVIRDIVVVRPAGNK